MASTRKQPSGSYQGIAVHPTGKRHTRTFPRRRQALTWAQELEATWRRGAAFDPRAGDRAVGAWIDVWAAARRVDPVTADKEASHLRNHIRPKWADWPAASVRKLDVAGWVKEMGLADVGAHTIVAVVTLFGTIMRAAADEGLITANPCARVKLPTPPAKPPFFWTREQAAAIVAEVPEPWRVAVDLDFHVGLRLGELLGLQVGAVDWAQGQAHVVGAMTRHGWRRHPKSSKSQRTVPIPEHLLDGLAPLVLGRDPAEFVFAGRGGKPVSDVNFRNRVWRPALAASGAPVGVPHDMRHTAASWLVMDGVDLYRVQALLGHASFAMTQRYAHLAPDAHERIRESWRRPRAGGADSSADSAQMMRGPGPDDRDPGR